MQTTHENTLKILLKGAADYTDPKEILEKLKEVEKENRPLRIKLGLDPSAPDIHLGHAVVLRKIKQLQDLGHQAVIIIGDFTGMIGDPTGKSKTRKQLTREQVEENAETYKTQIFKILNPEQTEVHFNSAWLSKLNFRDIIELASKTTVARILERDDFQKRYTTKQPISLHEFFYPLMQAYDSVAIKSDLELGGTDQVFNILMGRNIQKDYKQSPQITLFMPLLEGTDGVNKMSKSLGNYIGINEEPAVIYEKVMKVPDELIIKYYELATDIHPDDVEEVRKRLKNGENPRNIKMELAFEITRLYYDEESASAAQKHFEDVFQKQQVPDDVPVLEIVKVKDDNLIILIDTLMQSSRYQSKSEIRRLAQQKAIKINGEKIESVDAIPPLKSGDVIQVGKGSFYKIA